MGFWCLKCPNQGKVVFTINSALQWRGQIGTGFCGARCALSSPFPSQCVSGDYLILWRSRMWLQISYLLMVFTRRRNTEGEKRRHFLSLHKLVGAEAEKNDRVITVTLYSNPLSSVAISECPPYLGVYVPLSVFLRGRRMWVCACRGGRLWVPWNGRSCAFQLVRGGVGCKELSGQDPPLLPEQSGERRWHAAQQWDRKLDPSALLHCHNMTFTPAA